jgi:glutamine synthetase adenylyltransferase
VRRPKKHIKTWRYSAEVAILPPRLSRAPYIYIDQKIEAKTNDLTANVTFQIRPFEKHTQDPNKRREQMPATYHK